MTMRKYRRIAFPSHPWPKPTNLASLSAGYVVGVPTLSAISYETFLAIQLVPDKPRSPFEDLCIACLSTGLGSLLHYRHRMKPGEQRIYREECAWLMDENPTWPFSFANLCAYFGLDAAGIRRKVMAAPEG